MDFFSRPIVKQILLGIIFCIVAFFSVYKLTEAPAFWSDEGFFTQAAINIVRYGEWGMQISPGNFVSLKTHSSGFPLIAPLALSFKLFGIGVLQARAVMALFVVMLVIASFVLVRRLFSFYFAASSALLIATFPVLYGNGKAVLGEVPALLFFALYLLFLTRWLRSRATQDAVLMGLMLGVVITAKVSFLLVCIPAAAMTLFLYRSHFSMNARTASATVVALLVPCALWVMTQFRSSDTAYMFFETTFNHYEGGLPIMQQFIKNSLRFFTEFSPLYLLISGSIWGVSLSIRLYKKIKITPVEAHALLFVLLNVGVFLLSPGWYRYFFPAQIVVMWFLPHALFDVIKNLKVLHRYSSFDTVKIVGTIIIVLSSAQLYQTALKSFVADYYHSDRTARLERGFRFIPTDKTYFFYNVPEVVIFLPDVLYYQYISSGTRFNIGDENERGNADKIIMRTQTYNDNPKKFGEYEPEMTIADRYVILKKVD